MTIQNVNEIKELTKKHNTNRTDKLFNINEATEKHFKLMLYEHESVTKGGLI